MHPHGVTNRMEIGIGIHKGRAVLEGLGRHGDI